MASQYPTISLRNARGGLLTIDVHFSIYRASESQRSQMDAVSHPVVKFLFALSLS